MKNNFRIDIQKIINYIKEDCCIVIDNKKVVKSRDDLSSKKLNEKFNHYVVISKGLKAPIYIADENFKVVICNDRYLDVIDSYVE